MYVCEYCGAVFREPHFKRDYSPDYGNCSEYFCPECGESIVPEEVDECPECHGWKPIGEPMCRKCKLETLGNFRLAIRKFTDVQLDYISELADGEYLSEFLHKEDS